MAERRSQGLGVLAGIFLIPTEAEYRALRLPAPLYPLYYPFRALRLCAKYAARVLGFTRSA
jgi:hypothetical protein